MASPSDQKPEMEIEQLRHKVAQLQSQLRSLESERRSWFLHQQFPERASNPASLWSCWRCAFENTAQDVECEICGVKAPQGVEDDRPTSCQRRLIHCD